MQYEIYIDALMIIQSVMCYIALRLSNQLLHCSATHCRMIVGAFLGGISSSVIMVIPMGNIFLKIGIFHLSWACLLIYGVFCVKKMHVLFQGVGCFFLIMLLNKGFINSCFIYIPYLRECTNSMQWIGEMGAVLLLSCIFYGIVMYLIQKRQEGNNAKVCEVILRRENGEIRIKGLIDTGNSLVEPISGKAVCILGKEYVSFLQLETIPKGYCVIPYHAINEVHGILEGCIIDRMTIVHNGIERNYKDVLVASAPNGASTSKEYEIIIHPQLLEE